jgi:hypothetical protein
VKEEGDVPMLLVTLDFRIVHLTTNQTFGIKDSVFRVGVEGVLGGVSDTARKNTSSELWLMVG